MRKIIAVILILILMLRFRATFPDQLPPRLSVSLFPRDIPCETIGQTLLIWEEEEMKLRILQEKIAKRDRNFLISAVVLGTIFLPFGFLSLGLKGDGETALKLMEMRGDIKNLKKELIIRCYTG